MQNHEKLTKREIAMIGVTVVATCVAGYFGYKYFNTIKFEKLLNKDNENLKDSVDTLKAAMEETGRI